ncbi:MAG: hypothetical protein Q8Q11_02100 [bacterium]|nr:hypothetical protein [bacterium]MDZ4247728.1 hypothetical protein [Patescibacteria group bacterium]
MAKVKETTTRRKDSDEEYFKRHDDPYVLPPELNMTIRDGFRFGIGFVLAMLVFWSIAMVGAIITFSFGLV